MTSRLPAHPVSFAKRSRSVEDQERAPDAHASDRATRWSMSTSPATVQVAPSYMEYQRPVETVQRDNDVNVTVDRVSAWRTSARVSWQSPSLSIQCRTGLGRR